VIVLLSDRLHAIVWLCFSVLLADRTTGWKVEQYTSTVWLSIIYWCSVVQCSINHAQDFRFPPQCKSDLRPAGFLKSAYW